MDAYIDNYFILVPHEMLQLIFDWLNCFIGSAVLDLTKQRLVFDSYYTKELIYAHFQLNTCFRVVLKRQLANISCCQLRMRSPTHTMVILMSGNFKTCFPDIKESYSFIFFAFRLFVTLKVGSSHLGAFYSKFLTVLFCILRHFLFYYYYYYN